MQVPYLSYFDGTNDDAVSWPLNNSIPDNNQFSV